MMHGLGGVCGGDAAGKHHKLIIEEEPGLVICQLAVEATLITKKHNIKNGCNNIHFSRSRKSGTHPYCRRRYIYIYTRERICMYAQMLMRMIITTRTP